MTEIRGDRKEKRGQKTDDRGDRIEGRGQTTDDRIQRMVDTSVKYKTKGIDTLNGYNFSFLILDGLVKSRHSGENRSPEAL